jgi:hypothetical protein
VRSDAVELTICPQCGQPATVQWRALLDSTDGPFEHARVDCLAGHWFLMPADGLDRYPVGPAPAHRAVPTL